MQLTTRTSNSINNNNNKNIDFFFNTLNRKLMSLCSCCIPYLWQEISNYAAYNDDDSKLKQVVIAWLGNVNVISVHSYCKLLFMYACASDLTATVTVLRIKCELCMYIYVLVRARKIIHLSYSIFLQCICFNRCNIDVYLTLIECEELSFEVHT